ncbi:MAG: methionyl-tRNA formyltransferase, partial [Planctomycetota bacterium]|nr:methionyl-tRNA formyltransferase [Planctomycetota bacterium]
MRLVFFGSGKFGIPTLEALVARGYAPILTVSQPDRPAGRGGRASPTPIRRLAESLGLPLAAPERPNDPEFVARLSGLAPDLAVVVAYGHLIRKPLLEVPRLGFVNLHASLLPAYRGAAPVPWAIMRGEKESGVTVFQLDERFDTGAILARESLALAPDDTTGTYLEKLAPLGAGIMVQTVVKLEAGRIVSQRQDETVASVAPKL